MPVEYLPMRLSPDDAKALVVAHRCLEGRSFGQSVTGFLGRQVAAFSRALPGPARTAISKGSEAALRAALRAALWTVDTSRPPKSRELRHSLAAAASGALGGAFGLPALLLELPTSTTIILRSIAEIARTEGEDLEELEARLACIEVFALGPDSSGEAPVEGGYFAMRAGLAQSISESAKFLAKNGLASSAAPALLRLISQIAGRFGIVVTEKMAAQAVPIFGAIGGAAINLAFSHHYQKVARGHFIMRRLERTYGTELVQAEFRKLRGEKRPAVEARPSPAGV